MIAKPGEKFISKERDLILQYLVQGEDHLNKCLFVAPGADTDWKHEEISVFDLPLAADFPDREFDRYYDFNDYLKELDR